MGLTHAPDPLRATGISGSSWDKGARAKGLYALDSRADRLLAVYKELLR